RRARTVPLRQPPLDPEFVERCRLALARLVALEDEGVIAVCSARRREGRSSVAAALAVTLARGRAEGRGLLLALGLCPRTVAPLLSLRPRGRSHARGAAAGPARFSRRWGAPPVGRGRPEPAAMANPRGHSSRRPSPPLPRTDRRSSAARLSPEVSVGCARPAAAAWPP